MALRALGGKVEVPRWLALLWTVLPLAAAAAVWFAVDDGRDGPTGDQVAAIAADAADDAYYSSWYPDRSPGSARRVLLAALDHQAVRRGTRAPLIRATKVEFTGTSAQSGRKLLRIRFTVTDTRSQHPVCVTMNEHGEASDQGVALYEAKSARGACAG